MSDTRTVTLTPVVPELFNRINVFVVLYKGLPVEWQTQKSEGQVGLTAICCCIIYYSDSRHYREWLHLMGGVWGGGGDN